jgi:hypothetical protein
LQAIIESLSLFRPLALLAAFFSLVESHHQPCDGHIELVVCRTDRLLRKGRRTLTRRPFSFSANLKRLNSQPRFSVLRDHTPR